jgi:hypothetical protein
MFFKSNVSAYCLLGTSLLKLNAVLSQENLKIDCLGINHMQKASPDRTCGSDLIAARLCPALSSVRGTKTRQGNAHSLEKVQLAV